MCIIVVLELCHHIVVFIIVILYGLGAGRGGEGSICEIDAGFLLHYGAMWCTWTEQWRVFFWRLETRLGSELNFKVAWFDLSMINDSIGFGGFHLILLYFIVCIVQSDALRGEGKIRWLLNCCELKETSWLLLRLLYFFIFFAQVGMALILLYLLLLCIGTKCTCLICKILNAHYDAYNLRVHIKVGWKKEKSFFIFH